MVRSSALLILLIPCAITIATGCDPGTTDGDVSDATDASDGDTTTVPAPDNPLFDPSGEIALIETWSTSTGAVAASAVSAHLAGGPLPNLQRFVAEVGDCQLWTRPPASCEPPCNSFTQACIPSGACQDLPAPQSAGDITITGGTATLNLDYVGNGLYAAATDPPADAFAKGATLTVSAAGADIAAFSATVTGVGDLNDTFGEVALKDGSSTTINWVPAADGSTVEVVLQLGWHGNPPEAVLYCAAPDSAGTIVIAAELVDGFPYFGGMGLFQVPSWIQRVSRTDVQTASGLVAVYVASRQPVGVTHTE